MGTFFSKHFGRKAKYARGGFLKSLEGMRSQVEEVVFKGGTKVKCFEMEELILKDGTKINVKELDDKKRIHMKIK